MKDHSKIQLVFVILIQGMPLLITIAQESITKVRNGRQDRSRSFLPDFRAVTVEWAVPLANIVHILTENNYDRMIWRK